MVVEKEEVVETAEALRALRLNCPVIEAGDLILRPPHIEDATDIAALANNYEVARMLSAMPHPYFLADARDFIEMTRKSNLDESVYAITLHKTGEFIGVCGLHENPARFELPFIGYWIGEPYWGHGYATKAARAMTDLFFKVTDRDEMMATCRVDNHGSRAVIRKCGGVFWKFSQAYNKTLGETQSLENYRISREAWMERAAS